MRRVRDEVRRAVELVELAEHHVGADAPGAPATATKQPTAIRHARFARPSLIVAASRYFPIVARPITSRWISLVPS